MGNTISIKNFSLSFGKKQIIDDLSFEVKKGEIFGLLGSNGSGKTSIIRALLGLYRADEGKLLINGKTFEPSKNNHLGYLPEERGLYKKESVIDVMVYFGQLKGMSKKAARDWSLSYLEKVGLADKAKTKLDKLSGGQQQKVQLGTTIINAPDLLILDEPTKGFDPVNRQLLMDIIKAENERGTTIVMVTHQMEEVERFCHRALLLNNGAAEAYGTIDEIRNKYGEKRIILEFSGKLPKSKKFGIIKQEANYAELSLKASEQEILRELAASDLKINKFDVQKSTLNEIFLSIYGEEGQE